MRSCRAGEPYEPEKEKTTIIIPVPVSERQSMVENRAIVIEAGSEAWSDESVPRAKPGDKILMQKLAGVIVRGTADGKLYRLINDRDILCVIGVETNG